MTYDNFIAFVNKREKPADISPHLEAMYEDGIGHWDKAHDLAQQYADDTGNWIHAYLHRKEGDIGNAGYWYSRAGKTMPSVSLDEEWEIITRSIIGD